MHNYMIIRSLGYRWLQFERGVSIEIGFVRPNGAQVKIDGLDNTSLSTHDVEHLCWGVGYTLVEEFYTGYMQSLGKLTVKALFNRKALVAFHMRTYGRDLTSFNDLMGVINKEGGDYRLDLYGKDLIITKI